jgi:hypothetical protein
MATDRPPKTPKPKAIKPPRPPKPTKIFTLPVLYDNLKGNDRTLVRAQYVIQQGGACFHCGAPLDGDPVDGIMALPLDMSFYPPGFLRFPVHLHHDHVSGLTLGAVHSRCNAVLFQYYGE